MRKPGILHYGDTLPPATEFEDGDLFFLRTTGELYIRTGGAWALSASSSMITSVQNDGTGVELVSDTGTSNTAKVRTLTTTGNGVSPAVSSGGGEVELSFDKVAAGWGAANGFATLDASTKVVERLSYEGVASGVATLDTNTKVVERLSYEGVANGVATLDSYAYGAKPFGGSRLEPDAYGGEDIYRGIAPVLAGLRTVQYNPASTMHVLVIGDSVTLGAGAGGAVGASTDPAWWQESYVPLMREYLRSRGVPIAGEGIILPREDTRLSIGGTGIVASSGGLGGSATSLTASGDYISLTHDNAVRFDVLTYADTDYSIDISVDGGTPTTFSATAGSGVQRHTVYADVHGKHTLRIDWVSGTAKIIGIDVRESGYGVLVHRLGVSGAKVADWSSAESIACVNGISGADALHIINLTVNDYNAQTPLATYQSDLDSLVNGTRAAAQGTLLVAGHPRGVTLTIPQTDYNSAVKTVADTYQNVAYYSLYDAWDGDYAYWNSKGAYVDDVHPTSKGHALIASFIGGVLAQLAPPSKHSTNARILKSVHDLRAANTYTNPGQYTLRIYRVVVDEPMVVSRGNVSVGTASGQLMIGIYDSDGNRLQYGLATASAGLMEIPLTSPVSIAPGMYYIAVVVDNTTITLATMPNTDVWGDGVYYLVQSSFLMPSTISTPPAEAGMQVALAIK